MFNKRENPQASETETASAETPRRETAQSTSLSGRASAVIGPSIHIEGTLRGDEDLLIEGKVKGTVELKKNSVTIGSKGDVTADIYAHTLYVDGKIDGNLYASERVVVRKSAQVRGSISSPRVSLEDGARFNGSIDMDPETEALKKAFSGKNANTQAQPADKSPVSAVQTESTQDSGSSGSGSNKQNHQQHAKSRA
jgi:cytoskeletal protein CcmA (bactofilin family)